MAQSLLNAADAQTELFAPGEIAQRLVEQEETAGVYTAERFFQQKPELYRMVVHLLANNYGMLRIAEVLRPCGCSHHTVAAIRNRETAAIDIEKQRLAQKARYGAHLCIEGLVDDLADEHRRNEISTRDKAIVFGVLVDKGLVLEGQPTAIIEERRTFTQEDLNRMIEGLPRVYAVETGSGGEKPPAKEPAALPAADPDRPVAAGDAKGPTVPGAASVEIGPAPASIDQGTAVEAGQDAPGRAPGAAAASSTGSVVDPVLAGILARFTALVEKQRTARLTEHETLLLERLRAALALILGLASDSQSEAHAPESTANTGPTRARDTTSDASTGHAGHVLPGDSQARECAKEGGRGSGAGGGPQGP